MVFPPLSQDPLPYVVTGAASAVLDAPCSEEHTTEFVSRKSLLSPAPRRILLVDRDPDARKLARCFLESEGHQVFSCDDPARAVRFFCLQGRVDLLLTDIDLPYLSGIQLAREAVAARPQLPVVIASPEAPAGTIRNYLAQRGWQYLAKPYDIPAMLELVRNLMARPSALSRPVVRLANPPSRRPSEVA